MKTLTIRRGEEKDADAIQHVGCESYRDHFSHLWTPNGIQRFLDADFSEHVLRETLTTPSKHLWLVASESNQELVGYAKLNWSTPDPVFGLEGTELQKIYFSKSSAGKGYGTKLIEHILDCVTERSCGRIWLEVLKNNVNAQKFYGKVGFRAVSEIPFKTDMAEIGMVVMIRDTAA